MHPSRGKWGTKVSPSNHLHSVLYIYIYNPNPNPNPLCEIQTKVSKSNYEKTSINIWFLTLIPLYFQTLICPYSVNIKDIKVTFSQNVLYHGEGWYFVEKKANHKKMTLAGFSQKGSYIYIYIYKQDSKIYCTGYGCILYIYIYIKCNYIPYSIFYCLVYIYI